MGPDFTFFAAVRHLSGELLGVVHKKLPLALSLAHRAAGSAFALSAPVSGF